MGIRKKRVGKPSVFTPGTGGWRVCAEAESLALGGSRPGESAPDPSTFSGSEATGSFYFKKERKAKMILTWMFNSTFFH